MVGKCEKCGEEFKYPPSAKRKYCGKECYLEAHKTPEKKCVGCGVLFRKPGDPSHIYCSRDCWLENLEIWNKGKTGVQEPYWKGKKRSEETIMKISEARTGVTASLETKEKMSHTQRMIVAEKLRLGGYKPNHNPDACFFIDELGRRLGIEFQHAGNGGEYHIQDLGYWVDGYNEENNIVVEYMEPHHKRLGQRKKDEKRKQRIQELLKCDWIELWEE